MRRREFELKKSCVKGGVTSFSQCHGVRRTLMDFLFSVCKLQTCIYSLAELQKLKAE